MYSKKKKKQNYNDGNMMQHAWKEMFSYATVGS